jgi:hypothetical protein
MKGGSQKKEQKDEKEGEGKEVDKQDDDEGIYISAEEFNRFLLLLDDGAGDPQKRIKAASMTILQDQRFYLRGRYADSGGGGKYHGAYGSSGSASGNSSGVVERLDSLLEKVLNEGGEEEKGEDEGGTVEEIEDENGDEEGNDVNNLKKKDKTRARGRKRRTNSRKEPWIYSFCPSLELTKAQVTQIQVILRSNQPVIHEAVWIILAAAIRSSPTSTGGVTTNGKPSLLLGRPSISLNNSTPFTSPVSATPTVSLPVKRQLSIADTNSTSSSPTYAGPLGRLKFLTASKFPEKAISLLTDGFHTNDWGPVRSAALFLASMATTDPTCLTLTYFERVFPLFVKALNTDTIWLSQGKNFLDGIVRAVLVYTIKILAKNEGGGAREILVANRMVGLCVGFLRCICTEEFLGSPTVVAGRQKMHRVFLEDLRGNVVSILRYFASCSGSSGISSKNECGSGGSNSNNEIKSEYVKFKVGTYLAWIIKCGKNDFEIIEVSNAIWFWEHSIVV